MAKRQLSRFGGGLKHEARLTFWLPLLREFRNELGRSLKYFTLPGENAYDVIRWKQDGLLDYSGKGFPGVRFCDSNRDTYRLAKKILRDTPGMLASFEQIIRGRESEKYKPFWDLFPYDVYNLDFCGTCFETNEPPVSDTFAAIVDLINEHIQGRQFSKCLIFLTIRIDANRTNPDVIEDLKGNLQANKEIAELKSKITDLVGNDIDGFAEDRFRDFILVSIPKLLARNVIPQRRGNVSKLESLARAYYLRNDYHNDYDYYIGKFAFYVHKERRNSLAVRPRWYLDFVHNSLELQDVQPITKVSKETEDDLERLKAEVSEIENHDNDKPKV